jgi:hypothetical protein
MLVQSVLVIGVILTGLAYICHPPAAREIAKFFGKAALGLFAIEVILAFLWEDRLGRFLLVVAAMLAIIRLVCGRRE